MAMNSMLMTTTMEMVNITLVVVAMTVTGVKGTTSIALKGTGKEGKRMVMVYAKS